MESFDLLMDRARLVAQRIEQAVEGDRSIIVIGHLDADGITAASIVARSLKRKGGRFIIRILSDLDQDVLKGLGSSQYDLQVLCELGSGLVKEMDEFLGDDWILIDHHQTTEHELKHKNVFNCWQFGFDGSKDVSTAGMAYLVSSCLDRRNTDLAWLSVVGALGDRQDVGSDRSFIAINEKILQDAVRSGYVEVTTDLILSGRETKPVHEALASTTSLYIPPLSGNRDACLATVLSAGIEVKKGGRWRTLADLNDDEKKKLVETLAQHISSTPESRLEELVGRVYILSREDELSPIRDAREFATVLNSCGRTGRGGVGVSLCLGDRGRALDEAEEIFQEYRQKLNTYMNTILLDEKRLIENTNFTLIIGDGLVDEDMLGAVTSLLSNVPRLFGKPIFAKTLTKNGFTKFSGRVTKGVKPSINLGQIVRNAALLCGGIGGGHSTAAGAKLETARVNEFLRAIKEGIENAPARP
ncbi:MAG: DHH family phosphoesterase [Nitrososphaerota archaeon]